MTKLIKGEFDVDAPAGAARAVTPDNDADLPDGVCRAIHVGTAGVVRLTLARDSASVLFTLAAGTHPLRVRRVHAADLTANGIVALY
jgi:hypothetical protein